MMFNLKNENKSLGEDISVKTSSNLLFKASLLGLSIYLVSQVIGLLLTLEEYGPILEGGNVTKQLLTDLMFLFLSLCIIVVLTKGKVTQYGLSKPKGEVKWGSILGGGLLIGSIATITIIVTEANGNPALNGLSIREKILLIWFLLKLILYNPKNRFWPFPSLLLF